MMPDFKLLARLLPAMVSLLLLTACAPNPVTGGSDFVLMSEEQEISLGRKHSAEIVKQMPVYEDPELAGLVQRVGEQLASHSHRPELYYRFTVLDSKTVNAFALPGGYVYITRGMLAYLNSEAELAAVLGHEIGHVTARHSVRQQSTATMTGLLGAVISASTGIQGIDSLTDMAGTAIVRGYGRDHELEADRLGAEYLAKSGYDPGSMLEVVGILKNQETFEVAAAKQEGREPNVYHGLFSTHPDNDARFQEVVGAAEKFKTGATTRIGRESFLHALDGLSFGDSGREGIVRENRYFHKELDFALTFPQGWRIDNQAKKIVAVPETNDGLVQMSLADLNKRITPREFMLQRMGLSNLRQGKTFSNSGQEGYSAIADGKTPWGTRPVRYVVVYKGGSAYIFAGAAKNRNNPAQYDAEILATAQSFHPLSSTEQTLASEQRLEIIRAPRGARYADLAKKSPIANYPEQQLRLLNGQYPSGEPAAAQLLKVIR
jgi:predicted Zn-dependent protease